VTVMTAYQGEADYDAAPGVCRSCGGPCLTHKGSVWGYTCTACIDKYLDDGAAKGAARDRKERDRLARKAIRNDNQTSVTADRRQEGGGSELCAAPPSGVDRTGEGGGSALCTAPLGRSTTTRED
jgi:hypothetical protein